MCVIGVTGSLGSGKSTVSAMLAGLGAKLLDADKIAHRLLRPEGPCFAKVVQTFGPGVLKAGRIDRKILARRVFRSPADLRKLERIVHPQVRKEILGKIKEFKKGRRGPVVVVDVPLLFEAHLNRHMDVCVVVRAGRADRIARATRRLGITQEQARQRMQRQMSLRRKIRLADIIIDNEGSLANTKKQVKQLWEKLTQKKKS